MQYRFTLRQHVSAASLPPSDQYRTYKKVQQSEHSMGSHFVQRNGIPLSAHFVVPFYTFCIGLVAADLRPKHVALM